MNVNGNFIEELENSSVRGPPPPRHILLHHKFRTEENSIFLSSAVVERITMAKMYVCLCLCVS